MVANAPVQELLTVNDGLATNVSDLLRAKTKAKVLNNVRMLKRGVFTNRKSGWLKQRAGVFNAGAAFLDFGVFVDTAGVRTLIQQVGSVLMSYDLTTETNIRTGLSTSALPCMRMFSPYAAATTPYMVYCNGNIEPRKITGVAAEVALNLNGGAWPAATGAPLPVKTYSKPKFCELFLDRMAYFGFTAGATVYAQDVLISNSGDAETVTQSGTLAATDGGIFTIPAHLGPIVGGKTLKLNNENNDQVLIIGCTNGMAVITGSSALDFSMRILTEEYGIVSNRCWVQLQNDLYFLATDGIRRFSGLAQNANLLNATMTLELQDIMQRINVANASVAHATHHRLTQEVEWWFPLDADTQNKNCIVMNYNTDGSSPESIDPIFYTRDGTSVACSIDFKGVFYGGGYDGYLQQHQQGNLYDTTPVRYEIIPALISPGDAMSHADGLKLLVITEGGAQNFDLTAYVYVDTPQNKQVRQIVGTKTLSVPEVTGTVLGTWSLGTGATPAEHLKLIEWTFAGIGRFWEVQIVGATTTSFIDFLGVQYRLNKGEAR